MIKKSLKIITKSVPYPSKYYFSSINPKKDYYFILNIDPSTSENQIKQAYISLAKQFHPDINQQNTQKFKQINEAYTILGDQITRKQYDRLREEYTSHNQINQNQFNNKKQDKQQQNDYTMYFLKRNFEYLTYLKRLSIKNVGEMVEKRIEKSEMKEQLHQKKQKIHKMMPTFVWGISLTTTIIIWQQILTSQTHN